MKNFWLDNIKLQEIHAIAVETWLAEGTFSSFIMELSDEQMDMLMNMKFLSPNLEDNCLGLNLEQAVEGI